MKKILEKAIWIILGIIISGLFLLVVTPKRGKPIEIQSKPTSEVITIQISGEVVNPGLYTLSWKSRVNDAIKAAGGLTSNADTNTINLAKYLYDGDKIVVLSKDSVEHNSTQPIDINSAQETELDSLPGIGASKAAEIVKYREEHGPFLTTEDLMNVPGIGPSVYNKIKDLITVNSH